MSRPVMNEGRPHDVDVPPSRYAYARLGCRCDDCRRHNREYMRSKHADLRARLAGEFDSLPHGSVSTYGNWGCRCEPCVDAKRAVNAAIYARRRAEASPP